MMIKEQVKALWNIVGANFSILRKFVFCVLYRKFSLTTASDIHQRLLLPSKVAMR